MEESVFLEEVLSETLGSVMNISWIDSKSLGFGSQALSFNQKVTILQDKKEIPKDIKDKLTVLMHIRNKFAHVKTVDSFEKHFNLSQGGNQDKKFIDKWYNQNNLTNKYSEIEYRFAFLKLCNEIFYCLFNIYLKDSVNKAVVERDHALDKKFIEILMNKRLEGPITDDVWSKSVEETIKALNNN